jgi:hypothetical protein
MRQYFVGIDVSKGRHTAAVVDGDGEPGSRRQGHGASLPYLLGSGLAPIGIPPPPQKLDRTSQQPC